MQRPAPRACKLLHTLVSKKRFISRCFREPGLQLSGQSCRPLHTQAADSSNTLYSCKTMEFTSVCALGAKMKLRHLPLRAIYNRGKDNVKKLIQMFGLYVLQWKKNMVAERQVRNLPYVRQIKAWAHWISDLYSYRQMLYSYRQFLKLNFTRPSPFLPLPDRLP